MSTPTAALEAYLRAVEKALKRGDATEHTYRPDFKTMIEAFAPGVLATNEARRKECGSPDFVVTRRNIPLGFIEAKDIGKDLDDAEESDQMARYKDGLSNLILTDYLEFRWFVNGTKRLTAKLAEPDAKGKLVPVQGGAEQVAQLLVNFLACAVPTVRSPKELAGKMAGLARLIRDTIAKAVEKSGDGTSELHKQMEAFRQVLIHDMDEAQFADMYAQTIAYGMFAARCNHAGTERFTRLCAAHDLPKTNPFLRWLFGHIAGPDLDDRIVWAVDDLAELLHRAEIKEILADFGRATKQEDPVVHFYETFLGEYDATMKAARGVYYTPEPVVSYIVRSVDHLLKTEFGLKDGLADSTQIPYPKSKAQAEAAPKGKKGKGKKADKQVQKPTAAPTPENIHKVLILDPACGTGTFLHHVIAHIHATKGMDAGMWPGYVQKHLLPRLFGFELLMAPYAVAHLKLGLQLKGTGYDFQSDERLRVFLTNTLEAGDEWGELPLFANRIAQEAHAAGQVKQELPIMVVVGNPPYSGVSSNMSTDMQKIVDAYKMVDGQPLGERKHWLQDDYVKFIRFAQKRIEDTGYGVLAFITPHGYLDNPTFRGMRQNLMQTFDEIFVLDLHGNAKKKETAEDGGKDENVFDIQQGVAIGIFVRRKGGEKTRTAVVKHADFLGLRKDKYVQLNAESVKTTEWETVEAKGPNYLFVPMDEEFGHEYRAFPSVKEIFPLQSVGIQTSRDDLAIDFTREELLKKVGDFIAPNSTDAEVRAKFFPGKTVKKGKGYLPGDTRSWRLVEARKGLAGVKSLEAEVAPIHYRPFDFRFIFNSTLLVDWPRGEVSKQMKGRKNLGLCVLRRAESPRDYDYISVSRDTISNHQASLKDGTYLLPLYVQCEATLHNPAGLKPNLSEKFLADITAKLNLVFIPEGTGDLKKTFSPEDVFRYVYAVFHSPSYRTRYAAFLRTDFPRLPLTGDLPLFRKLCALGAELVALHLLEKEPSKIATFPVASVPSSAAPVVDKVRYSSGKVWINPTQYFAGVPEEVWNFHIGGYRVCEKWLKDRKGRGLSYDELNHYMRVVAAIAETIRVMDAIDQAAGEWPISR